MTSNQDPSIRSMTMIWFAMLFGLGSLALVTFLILIPNAEEAAGLEPYMFYAITFGLILAGTTAATVFYQLQVRTASQFVNPGKERLMAHYKSAFILKMALLEGPGLFSIVAGYLTQHLLFAVATGGILILMLIAKPTERQFREDFLDRRSS